MFRNQILLSYSSNPLQRDLYEDETVHVGESSIPFAGEGIKKPISGFFEQSDFL